MTLKFLLRLVDNLFRHPIRYLIPIVLLAGFAVLNLPEEDDFTSTGVVFVEDSSFLSSVTDIGGNNSFSFLSPADIAVEQLFGLLGTDTFTSDVLRRIEGTDSSFTYDSATLAFFRQGIGVGARPGSLLEVTGTSTDPATAQASAQGVIDQFIEWRIEADLAQSQSAETFLGDRAEERRAELEAAQDALASFLLLNPDPAEGTRPTAEAISLAELEAEVTAARERYEAALLDVETAQLATSQTEVDTRVNLRVVDQPALPTTPESQLVSNLTQVILFAILGAGASFGVLVMTTFTDTSIRFPAEVRDRLGKEPLAVVPRV
ncbi:MAG: hypothetical protein AAF081_12510 [Actinomycetota bacterium]